MTPPPSLRSPRSGRRKTCSQGNLAAYSARILAVSSCEPSSTMTHRAGSSDCPTMEFRVRRANRASLRHGVMRQ